MYFYPDEIWGADKLESSTLFSTKVFCEVFFFLEGFDGFFVSNGWEFELDISTDASSYKVFRNDDDADDDGGGGALLFFSLLDVWIVVIVVVVVLVMVSVVLVAFADDDDEISLLTVSPIVRSLGWDSDGRFWDELEIFSFSDRIGDVFLDIEGAFVDVDVVVADTLGEPTDVCEDGLDVSTLSCLDGLFVLKMYPLDPGLATRRNNAVSSWGSEVCVYLENRWGAEATDVSLIGLGWATPGMATDKEPIRVCVPKIKRKINIWY